MRIRNANSHLFRFYLQGKQINQMRYKSEKASSREKMMRIDIQNTHNMQHKQFHSLTFLQHQ